MWMQDVLHVYNNIYYLFVFAGGNDIFIIYI